MNVRAGVAIIGLMVNKPVRICTHTLWPNRATGHQTCSTVYTRIAAPTADIRRLAPSGCPSPPGNPEHRGCPKDAPSRPAAAASPAVPAEGHSPEWPAAPAAASR